MGIVVSYGTRYTRGTQRQGVKLMIGWDLLLRAAEVPKILLL